MRNLSSIVLKVLAGFLFYTVCVLAFVKTPEFVPATAKWTIIACFTAPALLSLFFGLALSKSTNKKRDAGIVLLSASVFTAFLVLTIDCLLLEEEFLKLVREETLTHFSDLTSGVCAFVGLAAVGGLLFRAKSK